jgi:hypothetical protein
VSVASRSFLFGSMLIRRILPKVAQKARGRHKSDRKIVREFHCLKAFSFECGVALNTDTKRMGAHDALVEVDDAVCEQTITGDDEVVDDGANCRSHSLVATTTHNRCCRLAVQFGMSRAA